MSLLHQSEYDSDMGRWKSDCPPLLSELRSPFLVLVTLIDFKMWATRVFLKDLNDLKKQPSEDFKKWQM